MYIYIFMYIHIVFGYDVSKGGPVCNEGGIRQSSRGSATFDAFEPGVDDVLRLQS